MTSYLDATGTSGTSVQPDVTYYYQVEATNSSGSSAFSNTASALVTLPTVSVTALPITATFAGPGGNPQNGYLDFHRTGDPSSPLTVTANYAGTAVAGTDYSALPTQVNFGAGEQDVVIPVTPVNTTPDIGSILKASILAGAGYLFSAVEAPVVDASHGLSVKLGDGSDGIILQGSGDGKSNLVPLTFTLPQNQPAGTTVVLSATNSAIVDLWSKSPDGVYHQVPWGTGGVKIWTVGTDAIPDTLYVGVTGGSTRLGDVQFTLFDQQPATAGVLPPIASAISEPATAVRLKMILNDDPNGDHLADTDISNEENRWLVGQIVDASAVVEAPAGLLVGAGYSWAVPDPGVAYHSYSAYVKAAQSTSLQPDDGADVMDEHTGTNQRRIYFYWLQKTGPAAGYKTENLGLQVTLANGVVIKAGSAFDLDSPFVESSAAIGTARVTAGGSSFGLFSTGAGSYGLTINANVTEPWYNSGIWNFVQLVRSVRREFGLVPKTVYDTRGRFDLDNLLPAQLIPTTAGTMDFPADGSSPQFFWDSPSTDGVDPGVLGADARDAFKTFIMYRPAGENSVMVPLEYYAWNYAITVKVVGGKYVAVGTPPPPALAGPLPISGPVTWTDVLKNK